MEKFILSISWMRKTYCKYSYIFNDNLPLVSDVRFNIDRSKNHLGRCTYNYSPCNSLIFNKTISMSNCFLFTEKTATETLLHEMIHLYLAYNNHLHVHHGIEFTNIMNYINTHYNFNICVAGHKDIPFKEKLYQKEYISILAKTKNNNRYIIFNYYNNTDIESIKIDLAQFYHAFSEIQIIRTINCALILEYFTHRIGSKSLRFNYITSDIIEKIKDYIIYQNKII